MTDIDIQIVELEPMLVASVYGFGESPEIQAFEKLEVWARPKGLLDDPETHRIFGFNNPNPSPGSPSYGYELWIAIGPEVTPEGDVRIEEFLGGLYAVTRCEVPEGQYQIITDTWMKLVTWREGSKYKHANHQALEESIAAELPGIEFVLDLYLPITE